MSRPPKAFMLLAAVVLGYVALRAFVVPVIHDEARTFQMYVLTGDWLPFEAVWDAGNHVLVTGLAQISYALFGSGLLALRMWSVLAFPLYALYTWRVGTMIVSPMVRWCLWMALLCAPFLLDFFSLFRGYGLAMAFLLMAVYHGARFTATGTNRHLRLALAAMAFAAFGSLSLLIMWCALLAGLSVATFRWKATVRDRRYTMGLITLLGIAPLVFAGVFSVRLAEHDALYFGSDLGLFKGTIGSIAQYFLGSNASWIFVAIALLFITVSVIAARSWRNIFTAPPAALMITCAVLLFADLAGRVVLGEGFGVLYPTDRTAMQLVPLFLILFALALDRYATRHVAIRSAALIMLVFPVRTLLTANFDRTAYWPEQAIPEVFFRLAEERQRTLDRPLMIGVYHQMVSCWNYGSWQHGRRANSPDPEGFPQPSCDMLLIDTTFKLPPPGFRTIACATTGHNNLMERVMPLRTKLLLDSSFQVGSTTDEFVGIWDPDQMAVGGRELFVDVQAVISAEGSLGSELVLEVSDRSGEHLAYAHAELDLDRSAWRADTLRLALRLPAVTAADARTVLYIFNPKHHRFALDAVRLRVHEVAEGEP
ncbi:MAG: hypothetical protein ABI432_13100 [Flavobacteriales bacterium]